MHASFRKTHAVTPVSGLLAETTLGRDGDYQVVWSRGGSFQSVRAEAREQLLTLLIHLKSKLGVPEGLHQKEG